MRGRDPAQAAAVDALQDARRLFVRQMPLRTADAELEERRVASPSQHRCVVIALEQQCMDATQGGNDVRGGFTGVGQ